MSFSEEETRTLLATAVNRFDWNGVAARFGLSVRTLERWADGPIPAPGFAGHALRSLMLEERPALASDFTFIDLFAGIGGTRLGIEAAGGKCVFTCEYDRFCQQTYRANFQPEHDIAGDIRSVPADAIPDHDVLVAGFPCQPFSIAGVSKKNALGRAHGFECQTQGTLFFEICRIIAAKRPAAFILENVRNLKSHDKGKTFRVIEESLRDLGYHIDHAIIDAKAWVPQHRERIFIVGFRERTAFSMQLVEVPSGPKPVLARVLHPENGREQADGRYTVGIGAKVDKRYTLTKHLWTYLRNYADKHKAAGNGFGYGLVTPEMTARTLSARYYKDGSEILVSRGRNRNPRRLTPRECARLMGFADNFKIPVSDTQAYKQFGNSVVVPVVAAVAQAMKPHLLALKTRQENQLAMAV